MLSLGSARGKKDPAKKSTLASKAHKVAKTIKGSKRRKAGVQEVNPKGKTHAQISAGSTKDVTPVAVAEELLKTDAHWSSKLSLPLWCVWTVVSIATIREWVATVSARIVKAGISPTLELFADKNFGPVASFVVYCEYNHVPYKDALEVLKLLVLFYSLKEFARAVTAAQEELSLPQTVKTDSLLHLLYDLLKSPKKLRSLVRGVGQTMGKKAANIPEDVTSFDKEVNAMRQMIKEYHTAKRKEIEVIRAALKKATMDYEEDQKKFSKVQEFVNEYTELKSGKISLPIRERAVAHYKSNKALKQKYTLEQYLRVFSLRWSSQQVEKKLGHFRGLRGYKKGSKMVKAWENPGQEEALPSPMEEEKAGEDLTAADEAVLQSVFGADL